VTLGQIRVSVHWTFLLLLGWVALVNFLSGWEGNQILWSFFLLVAGTCSILIHEAAHISVARHFGYKTSKLVLLPAGDMTDMDLSRGAAGKGMLISIAGPVANLLIAGILLLFIHPYKAFYLQPENLGAPGPGSFLFQLHVVNLLIAGLNLIPAYPLDGGRILLILLSLRMREPLAMRVAITVGKVMACLLILSGFIYSNFLLTTTGIFLFLVERPKDF
jgi:Zn-dependent protease